MTGRFLRKRIWIWPILAAVLLACFGWWVRYKVESTTQRGLTDQLTSLLQTDVTALKFWLAGHESQVRAMTDDDDVRSLVGKLSEIANQADGTGVPLAQAPELAELRKKLAPWLEAGTKDEGYCDFFVVEQGGRVIAATHDDWIGKTPPQDEDNPIEPVFAGRSLVTHPTKSRIMLHDVDGELRAGIPVMFAVAPVLGANDEVLAALALRMHPEAEFSKILSVARLGENGETYAFDTNGVLLSESRFEGQLKAIGVLADDAQTHSLLNVQIRDPEVNMTLGHRPPKRCEDRDLTRMAADATAGNEGIDLVGYRDYRGVPVVGAWTWLPEYEFGVAVETDVAEAYASLYFLRTVFVILFGLVIVAGVGMFAFSLMAERLKRKMRHASLDSKQLGQYSLDEEIGKGGMGVVYRAHHALLQRPTAVKLLDLDKTTDQTVARFEREVRLTSQLNHPNTIAVYDYGHTPEGIFYYAMEYLDGITLDTLVSRYGAQPEGRVISILRQICGSLGEAHAIGLIHRDVKPANVIINRRGGMYDVIKLLDFGLVKAVDTQSEAQLTAVGTMTGTPLYMSPEVIQRTSEVDLRSDLYAVGAVGYFLLTATPLFSADSAIDVCMHHVNTQPEPPSKRLRKPVSEDLEALLMKCLSKNPADRPQTAAEFIGELDGCKSAAEWTQFNAEGWWHEYAPDDVQPASTSASGNIAETMAQDQQGTTD